MILLFWKISNAIGKVRKWLARCIHHIKMHFVRACVLIVMTAFWCNEKRKLFWRLNKRKLHLFVHNRVFISACAIHLEIACRLNFLPHINSGSFLLLDQCACCSIPPFTSTIKWCCFQLLSNVSSSKLIEFFYWLWITDQMFGITFSNPTESLIKSKILMLSYYCAHVCSKHYPRKYWEFVVVMTLKKSKIMTSLDYSILFQYSGASFIRLELIIFFSFLYAIAISHVKIAIDSPILDFCPYFFRVYCVCWSNSISSGLLAFTLTCWWAKIHLCVHFRLIFLNFSCCSINRIYLSGALPSPDPAG